MLLELGIVFYRYVQLSKSIVSNEAATVQPMRDTE